MTVNARKSGLNTSVICVVVTNTQGEDKKGDVNLFLAIFDAASINGVSGAL